MDARGRLAKFTIQEHVTCVKGRILAWGGGGTKKAHIARIGQTVAYFGRCLIIISKDKITSYHIWKIFLQSFSHEMLVANGDDDDGDYNMKTHAESEI